MQMRETMKLKMHEVLFILATVVVAAACLWDILSHPVTGPGLF